MSTLAAASKLLRFTNIPLHTLLRSCTTTSGAQLFTFNITNTANQQTLEEFKPNGQRETFFLQPNGYLQNFFSFTAAVDQSKAEILCRRNKVVDDSSSEDEDYDFEEEDDDDCDYHDDGFGDEFDDDGDFSDAEDQIEDEDVEPRKR